LARYVIPQGYGISRQTFDEIDTLIRSMRTGSKEFSDVMGLAARLMAHTTQGYAMRYYRGAQAPGGRAGTIPVRRITGASGRGWRVRRVSPGAWEVFNEERGAWMVEHGIVAGGGGVRRPILRMSGVATLRFIQRTRFAERIMSETFGSLRDNKGRFRSFSARMQGSTLLAAPMTSHVRTTSARPRIPSQHRWAARQGLLRTTR
jgi:hypothetical protein